MGLPLSRLPELDSEVPHLIPLPDGDETDRSPVDGDTWWGHLVVALTGLACVAGAYGTSYVAELWPEAAPGLFMLDSAISMSIGVWVVRKKYANPWFRKYRRWRGRYEDWRFQALQDNARLKQVLQALDRLDEAACDFTGEDDPAVARERLLQHLEQQKPGRRLGRPRHSATGRSPEKRREITREIRRLREQGYTWANIAARYEISGATARNWCAWLEEEERKGIA